MNLAKAALLYMKIHQKVVDLDSRVKRLREGGQHDKASEALSRLGVERHYAVRLGSVEVDDDAIREALDGYEYVYEPEDGGCLD